MESEAWLAALTGQLGQQMRFATEIDSLKTVLRDSPLADGSRLENSAEHSWHLAMLAITLADHASAEVNLARVIHMLLIHDIVEIDAGDVSIFDKAGREQVKDREHRAAERIFGILPQPQASQLLSLWHEFGLAETADAQFARALDALQPLILNHAAGGGSWLKHDSDITTLRSLKSDIRDWSPTLWTIAEAIFEDAVTKQWLRP